MWIICPALWLFATPSLVAEWPVSVGIKTGIPTGNGFQFNAVRAATDSSSRWIVGPAAEFRFSKRFSIEGSALYRSVANLRLIGVLGRVGEHDERGHLWSFPILAKYYYLPSGKLFVSGGIEMDRLRTSTVTNQPDGPFIHTSRSSTSTGGASFTGGGGLRWPVHRFWLSMEARYLRRFAPPEDPDRFLRRNQVVFLGGAGFN